MLLDVLLLSRLFGKTANGKDKNSNLSTKKKSSPILLQIIIPKEPLNLLFRAFGNYGKLKKQKPRTTFIY